MKIVLDDSDAEVRAGAAAALRGVPLPATSVLVGQEALPALQRALHDPDPVVRQAAGVALGRLSSREAGRKLELFLQTATDPKVRQATEAVGGTVNQSPRGSQ
jgi:HEAT repeat protein